MVYKPVKVISNERYVIGESGDSQLVESLTGWSLTEAKHKPQGRISGSQTKQTFEWGGS